ncbi:hypothetical protein PATSB16_25780 [Pandoraea thiooxydans]|nr:hypothetical protein PATSB16_25780 [Pandoraea thiooxydans]
MDHMSIPQFVVQRLSHDCRAGQNRFMNFSLCHSVKAAAS